MGFLQKSFVALFGFSIFSAGAGWAYVLLTSTVADGTGGFVTKGFFVPLAAFTAIFGAWMITLAFKSKPNANSA